MTTPATTDGLILLIGSGGRDYREYLLAGAAARRPLWLLDAAEPTWQRPHLAGATVVPLLDPERLVPDVEGLVKAAAAVAADHPVAGVFSYDETLVTATAEVAAALGLPGLGVEGADNCRDKHRTRRLLTEAGLLQPRFAHVGTLAEAQAAAGEFGYPVVLKPRGMGASIGVVRATGAAELAAAFAVAEGAGQGGNPAYRGGVLVEEFLDGPEISIDGAVHQGRYTPFFLAHKQVGAAPYFEETGHTVSADEPLLADPELTGMLAAAHRALGLRDGITHTEVKLTARGPAIVEVNGRLGGDLIPYLGKLATGLDPARIAVDVAAGREPELAHRSTATVGIRFAYPPQDGVVREVLLPVAGQLPGLRAAAAIAGPGTLLRLPPRGYIARHAYVIAEAADRAGCLAALDAAEGAVGLRLDPAEPQE
ncbi:ATP-grasp domain-containing protein [Kitasatospora sp. LaBMicrA B282]|uniref:ATP-grasp domain-containing protein n=1 Tax=Kitasatospora sp. LaBMicrA B282 TaxID=3420949 RepID=UPI003D1381D5